jgi:DNA invertase Pin-like site-specific DNA recombinase
MSVKVAASVPAHNAMGHGSVAVGTVPAAVGYTSGPVADGPEARLQREHIEQACRRLGLDLLDVVHDDVPVGRTTADRPGLRDLLDRIDSGQVGCLMVSELERLAGNVHELGEVLARMEGEDRRLIALDMELDTDTRAGRLAVTSRRKVSKAPQPITPGEAEATAPPPSTREAPPRRQQDDDVAPRRAQEPPSVQEVPSAEEVAPRPSADRDTTPPARSESQRALRTLGYASVAADDENVSEKLESQANAIEEACSELGLSVVEVIRERVPKSGKALDRAGVSYLVERLAAGDASCVVVTGLDRLSHSVAELGKLVEWFGRCDVRLIAVDLRLDTATADGQTAARALTSVAGWEQERLSERTRKGLAAARAKRRERGDASTPDWAAVNKRIALMRADGMTLQAIADVLNEEGVPTPRGGAIWRPSSVQTAAGYKRRRRQAGVPDLPATPSKTK